MAFYEGQRFSYDGNLCILRYHGALEGTQGEWLGVEWDDPSRGKHDGTYKGKRIFSCLSASPTAASFIRPTRAPDRTRSVLEAIKDKYEQSSKTNGELRGPGYEIIEISKKKVEEVGFEKIKQQMSQLENLKIAVLDQLGIKGLLKSPSSSTEVEAAQKQLATICPNITELDLGWNPIETWEDIFQICAPLSKLRILKANGLRLRSCVPEHTLPQITELHLNECLLQPDQILDLLLYDGQPAFPNLKMLWLSQNDLDSFKTSRTRQSVQSVKTLVLENNKFTDLSQVARVCQHFPNVDNISLQGNIISMTGTRSLLSSTLTALNLASNEISDFTFIDTLPNLFTKLSSLRISRNPLYERLAYAPPSTNTDHDSISTNSGKPSDAPFYLTLARIPTLRTLNYTTITPRDREEGEIYYISLADKAIRSSLLPALSTDKQAQSTLIDSLSAKYPLYTHLTTKYDRPNLFTDPSSAQLTAPNGPATINFAANASLASRLVVATFHLPSSTTPSSSSPPRTFTRPLPTTTPVYTLKSLLARHFNLKPLQFKVIYESDELDPEQVTTTKLWGSSVESWREWGEWDADLGVGGNGEAEGEGMEREGEKEDEGVWVEEGKVLLRGGTRWRRREVEVVDGWRGWGDYLDDTGGRGREIRVRIEPF